MRVQQFYNIIVRRRGGGGRCVDEADERPSGCAVGRVALCGEAEGGARNFGGGGGKGAGAL